MNNRTELLSKSYKPELSIMVYKASDRKEDFYLESHQISEDGKVMEGKPLLQETVQEIVDVFFDHRKDRSLIGGYVPETLLTFTHLPGGHFRMVWYRPAEIRMIHFAAPLKLNSGKAWVPPLIYVAERNGLYVYALKANTRPKVGTKLYRAPFHNVADNGDVCLGSAKIKKPTEKSFMAIMKYWEDLFWLSEFSHLNGASNPTKSKLWEVWKKLLASKEKKRWSDIDELIDTKVKIKGMLV